MHIYPKGNSRIPERLAIGLRLLLGAVFLLASYDKILHPQAFAQAVYNYRILPDGLVNLAAMILPWLELLLGVCLIGGVWLPGATLIGTGLLALFIGALVYNQVRGLDIHCGCFSSESTAGPAGSWTVARDMIFLAISMGLTYYAFLYPSVAQDARMASDKESEGGQWVEGESMLRRNFLRWTLMAMLLAPVLGAAEKTPARGPEAFLPESVYEFQPVLEGTEVVHEFVLKNKGEAPLNILQIKSG